MHLNFIATILEKALEKKIDIASINKSEKFAIGLYYNRNLNPSSIKIGGDDYLSYKKISINILFRMGKDALYADCEMTSIFDKLKNIDIKSIFIIFPYDMPIWLGKDSMGIYEYSIDIDFYINKN